MKPGEIRAMSEAAILSDIADKQKKILETRCAVAMGDEVNAADLKKMKRDVARLYTIKREKELSEGAK
ncbi:hypothetical protein FACS1894139_15220 [Planctomycetales bacterium]|jgi:ribosomal protein L29|nr:50S ribosomal protein L29 [Planctomycetota bacterium]GHS92213.1 hypothetical protein FACS1894107_07650 [Planctomycetales bacterium]GHS99749.1 hypothetical protein FACS1894108_10320 [Planctomycetales bacterium]GHT07260.1 hypothetical protein FACS1894139_15220 [Planctomycetales bacterium]GHV18515.1 hypothetical protein AGMMS49959_00480 [Planctomycetales bacterium]